MSRGRQMIRMILVALWAGILAVAKLLVLAANSLPWWGFLLTLLGVAVGLWAAVRLLTGRLFERLFSIPFRAKGGGLARCARRGPLRRPCPGTTGRWRHRHRHRRRRKH